MNEALEDALVYPYESEIERQTRKLIQAQHSSTEQLVEVNQETIEALDTLASGMAEVSMGLSRLSDVLAWGLSDISYQLSKQSELLQRLIEGVELPRTTKANEARRLGIERFSLGWYEEALREFELCLESNDVDYIAYLYISLIHIVKSELSLAYEMAQKAIKYAEPYSQKWAGLGYSLVARIHYLQENYEKALQAAQSAVAYDIRAQGNYESARAQAKLGQNQEAANSLMLAIQYNPEYFELSTTEPAFDGISEEVHRTHAQLLEIARLQYEKYKKQSSELQRLMERANQTQIGESYFAFEHLLTRYRKSLEFIPQDPQQLDYLPLVMYRAMLVELNQTAKSKLRNEIASRIDNSYFRTRKELLGDYGLMAPFAVIGLWLVLFCRGCSSASSSTSSSNWDLIWYSIIQPTLIVGGVVIIIVVIAFTVDSLRDQRENTRISRKKEQLRQLIDELE